MIEALDTAMDSYSTAVPKTKTAKSVKSAFGTNLKVLVKDINAILFDQMDKMINTFKAANPDFVSTYKNARVIIDPKKTKKQKPAEPAKVAA